MSPDRRMTVAPMPGSGEGRGQTAPAAHADHQLRGVDGSGELDQGGRGVFADHLVVRAAERLDQSALLVQRAGRAAAQAVLRRHVHGQQLATG
ncbi:hypothetical protein QE410_003105 [Microbacterium sp. SORGH_AS 1204]|nr:hypothetical protein [Microbacterium sp. SORGH_AS_1204]